MFKYFWKHCSNTPLYAVKVQMVNITEKNIDVLTVKLLETEKVEEILKQKNCEIEVKLFTNDKTKEIYFSRVSRIKYSK